MAFMKLTFLGVGSAFSRTHPNSSVLVEQGEIKLLIDCGWTAPGCIEEYGLSLSDITHIFITHLHADHVGGLEEMAIRERLFYQHKPTLVTTSTLLDRLWLTCLKGGLEYIEATPNDETAQTLADFFEPVLVPGGQWVRLLPTEPLRLYLHATDHVKGMECYGLEMETETSGASKRLFFSGDSKFNRECIIQRVQSCEQAFQDCQLYDSGHANTLGVHASYSQLQQLPADIRQKLWLYHYGDQSLPPAEDDGFLGFVETFQSFII
jgi:ribonuclease BN (tRNA processing enzyme)